MSNKETTKTLDRLKSMTIEERKDFLKKSNINKTIVCDYLLKDEVKIPMKSLVLKTLSSMSDDKFIDLVSSKINLVPIELLEKLT